MLTLTQKIIDRWLANDRQKKELAALTGLHTTEICRFVAGRRQFTLARVEQIAAACGMKVGPFITHIEEGTWPAPAAE